MTKVERLIQIYKESNKETRSDFTYRLLGHTGATYHLSPEVQLELPRLSLDERIELMTFCLEWNDKKIEPVFDRLKLIHYDISSEKQFIHLEAEVTFRDETPRKIMLIISDFIVKEDIYTFSTIKRIL